MPRKQSTVTRYKLDLELIHLRLSMKSQSQVDARILELEKKPDVKAYLAEQVAWSGYDQQIKKDMVKVALLSTDLADELDIEKKARQRKR